MWECGTSNVQAERVREKKSVVLSIPQSHSSHSLSLQNEPQADTAQHTVLCVALSVASSHSDSGVISISFSV